MDFRERNVMVLIKSRPFGKIINFEGWRAAVGMFGMDHRPVMLFMGDGVYALLKNIDTAPIRMFKSTYESFEGRTCVSARSLRERGISTDELSDGVEVLDEEGLSRLFNDSELIITF